MADRYDLMTGREGTDKDGNTKTFWTKIATVFKVKDKDQFRVKFDALPIPRIYTPENGDPQIIVEAMMFPPRENDGQQGGGGGGQRQQQRKPAPDLDEDIPF